MFAICAGASAWGLQSLRLIHLAEDFRRFRMHAAVRIMMQNEKLRRACVLLRRAKDTVIDWEIRQFSSATGVHTPIAPRSTPSALEHT